MQRHGYVQERRHFVLDAQRLAGLMTGVLDLVVQYQERFWVIDYKTNVLGADARSTTRRHDSPPPCAKANTICNI